MKCALLGKKLAHSYSPLIHSMLSDYEYKNIEVPEDKLEDFILNGEWDGLNVTIPYKKSVIPFCSYLSENARAIGSVNTLVKDRNGKISGYNTDYSGFLSMVRKSGIEIRNRKVLVLGSGGASNTAVYALRKLEAREVIVISRGGENNYDNIQKHYDAEVIVNTTPVGMFPKVKESLLDLSEFDNLYGIIDVIYNPVRTGLILQAETLGIPYIGGIRMLVAQAKEGCEIFTGSHVPEEKVDFIESFILKQTENIILIGMPGCGKTAIAEILGEKLNREVVDTDRIITEKSGKSISSIFESSGEEGFRLLENDVLYETGKRSGLVISTGGGCVTKKENYAHLHRNGKIIWIKRDPDKLPKDGRPISEKTDLKILYEKRASLYDAFADIVVINDGTLEEAAKKIISELDRMM